jgi:hypothetical protein
MPEGVVTFFNTKSRIRIHKTTIIFGQGWPITEVRESLVVWKDQYSWPPSTEKYRSVALITENISLFCLTSCLYKEVICTEPSPSVRVSCKNDNVRYFFFLLRIPLLKMIMNLFNEVLWLPPMDSLKYWGGKCRRILVHNKLNR